MNLLIKNIKQLVTVHAKGKLFKSGLEMSDIGLIENATVLIQNGVFDWIGSDADFKKNVDNDIDIIDASDLVALPGFVDSHTHLVFSEGHNNSYLKGTQNDLFDIIHAARTSTKKELKKYTRRHLDTMMRQGTTTVEIKSGYGLNENDEIKILEAINELSKESLVDIIPTFFGTKALPPEFKENPNKYVDLICDRLLPYISQHNMAKFCNVSCEHGGFTIEQCRKIFERAKSLGMKLKIFIDHPTQTGTSELAAEFGATSADHLIQIDDAGIGVLKQAGSIATILPGISFYLHSNYSPARKIIDAGVPLAIASGFNPITCMSYSMPSMMTIACTQMSLSPEETITASTLNGAAAIGLSNKLGSIEIGKQADIVLYNISNYRYLISYFGTNHVVKVIKRGTFLDF